MSSEFQHNGRRLTLQVSGGLKDSDMAQKETHTREQSRWGVEEETFLN